METRKFSVNGRRDAFLCKTHQDDRTARGERLGVPLSAGAIMFGLEPWPTGQEPCEDCEEAPRLWPRP